MTSHRFALSLLGLIAACGLAFGVGTVAVASQSSGRGVDPSATTATDFAEAELVGAIPHYLEGVAPDGGGEVDYDVLDDRLPIQGSDQTITVDELDQLLQGHLVPENGVLEMPFFGPLADGTFGEIGVRTCQYEEGRQTGCDEGVLPQSWSVQQGHIPVEYVLDEATIADYVERGVLGPAALLDGTS